MLNLLRKEISLAASPLSYLFIAAGVMFLIPGYPILCGAFFVTLGIFQSFQSMREANDIVFSALLPIAKRDVVKGKYLFSCFIEFCGFVVMEIATLLRMTALSDVSAYKNNALMNANPFALGLVLVIFGFFNLIFIGGFFRTAYKFAKPFVSYIVTAFIMIGTGEALHHFPGLGRLNAFGFEHIGLQICFFSSGAAIYALLTFLSYKSACRHFEKIDL